VLDVDGDLGVSTLQRFVSEHSDEPQPETMAVKTARGFHLYFAYPASGRIPNSVEKVGFGLDIRGDGGYVLCPPSLHPSGVAYEWLCGDHRLVQPAPVWLLAAILGIARHDTEAESAAPHQAGDAA
jgi:hypothetical protein